jgi:hypothetical protein
MPPDPRKVVEAYIKTKALRVTCEAECARCYGSRKKTFMVQGVVADVIQEINPRTGKQGTSKIVADFELGEGQTEQAAVVISSVQISFLGEQLNVENAIPVPVAAAAAAAAAVNNNATHVTASTNIIATPVPAAAGAANSNPAPVSEAPNNNAAPSLISTVNSLLLSANNNAAPATSINANPVPVAVTNINATHVPATATSINATHVPVAATSIDATPVPVVQPILMPPILWWR